MKYTQKLARRRRNWNYKSTKIFGLKVKTLQHSVVFQFGPFCMEVSQYSLNFGCIVLKRRGLKEIKSDMSEIVLIIGLIFFQISDWTFVTSEFKILFLQSKCTSTSADDLSEYSQQSVSTGPISANPASWTWRFERELQARKCYSQFYGLFVRMTMFWFGAGRAASVCPLSGPGKWVATASSRVSIKAMPLRALTVEVSRKCYRHEDNYEYLSKSHT